jgi:cytochrome c-type biogenesis protein
MLDVSLGGGFVAGLLSFFSPCVLPIVPPYLAWLAGVSFEELKSEVPAVDVRRRVVVAAIAFVLGFTTVFVALGATSSTIGKALAQHFDLLSVVAGAIITLMGLHFLGVFRLSLLYREARIHVPFRVSGFLGAYVMGLAFAFGWTPCAGPALAAILFVAGSEDSAGRGALLLAVYSLGIGIPFILAAIFAGRFLGWSARFRQHMRKVEMAMGGLLVVIGALFISGRMSAISYWLLDTFPVFQTIG